jgi:farnesyl-diphosphate farnesyltransferase
VILRKDALMASSTSDELYQDQILPHVSRTFALTIPQLPPGLRTPVTNAYLLCRIADTIEDETSPSAAAALVLLERFVAVVRGAEEAAPLVADLARELSGDALPAERDLVQNTERVVRVTALLPERQRRAIERCVERMCGGMHRFQQTASLRGLPRVSDMDEYCYYVAGVVGEMLTELFCSYSPAADRRRRQLQQHEIAFAQGLQMTNILKDVWEDRKRGVCWLPQDVFARHGVDLARLAPGSGDTRVDAAIAELVGIAHAHLTSALSYTLLIPRQEAGIRRFCLWAIGLAVLTLRKIERTPGFHSGAEVKVSRSAVARVRLLTSVAARSDWLLRGLFAVATAGMTLGTVPAPARDGASPAGASPAGASPAGSEPTYTSGRPAP